MSPVFHGINKSQIAVLALTFDPLRDPPDNYSRLVSEGIAVQSIVRFSRDGRTERIWCDHWPRPRCSKTWSQQDDCIVVKGNIIESYRDNPFHLKYFKVYTLHTVPFSNSILLEHCAFVVCVVTKHIITITYVCVCVYVCYCYEGMVMVNVWLQTRQWENSWSKEMKQTKKILMGNSNVCVCHRPFKYVQII